MTLKVIFDDDLDLQCKNDVRNEFLWSNLYRKVQLHMILGHLVKTLHFDCNHFELISSNYAN